MGGELKVFFKWGLIIVAVLLAWRFLAAPLFGALGGLLGGGGGGPVGPVPSPSEYAYQGVYGTYMIPMGNPFYQSTNGGRRPRRA
jgi:hypothetical protein